MKIIIDERENDLYSKLIGIVDKPANIQILKEVLPLGDIYIKTDDNNDVLLIERKTFADLLASIKDGRYDEQSYRLTHSSGFPQHNIIYLVEGIMSQMSQKDKTLIFSTMTSLNYFKGFSVMRTSSVMETAEWILALTSKIERDFKKGKKAFYFTPISQTNENNEENGENSEILNATGDNNPPANYCTVVKKVKKDNITAQNIGEIVLCQIPGISSATALAIMKNFSTFADFFEKVKQNPEILDGIQIETNGKKRKISKTNIENIKKYLFSDSNI
jgi:ERCC4-type nuclease